MNGLSRKFVFGLIFASVLVQDTYASDLGVHGFCKEVLIKVGSVAQEAKALLEILSVPGIDFNAGFFEEFEFVILNDILQTQSHIPEVKEFIQKIYKAHRLYSIEKKKLGEKIGLLHLRKSADQVFGRQNVDLEEFKIEMPDDLQKNWAITELSKEIQLIPKLRADWVELATSFLQGNLVSIFSLHLFINKFLTAAKKISETWQLAESLNDEPAMRVVQYVASEIVKMEPEILIVPTAKESTTQEDIKKWDADRESFLAMKRIMLTLSLKKFDDDEDDPADAWKKGE